jgi:hypothetical protein
MHADRTNRVLLALIGLVALAIGAGGLLISGGVFGKRFSRRLITDNQFVRYFARHGDWLWPTIAGVAFLILLLTLFWLLRLLFSTDRAGDIALPSAHPSKRESRAQRLRDHAAGASGAAGAPERDHATGRTSVSASALSQAVAQEIDTYHGVLATRARVLGEPADPSLVIEVKASRRADLPTLVLRIEQEAILHAREALESPGLPVKLDIAVTDKGVVRAT